MWDYAYRVPAVAEVDVALLVPERQLEDKALVEAGQLQLGVHAVVDLVKDAGYADEQRRPQRLHAHVIGDSAISDIANVGTPPAGSACCLTTGFLN